MTDQEKIFPDKFADKKVLDESEVAFCNKKGIYDVDYNWKFLQGASKIKWFSSKATQKRFAKY